MYVQIANCASCGIYSKDGSDILQPKRLLQLTKNSFLTVFKQFFLLLSKLKNKFNRVMTICITLTVDPINV